jgi:enoyl-CoA hydratase
MAAEPETEWVRTETVTATLTEAPPAGFEHLLYEEADGVATITLNRPAVRNALSMQLSDELIFALRRVRRSSGVRVLVLRGAGGTFCAGDDISEMHQWGNANHTMRRVRLYQDMADQLEALDKATIAVVEGYAVGGGLELTMACDFVLAAEDARWGMPEIDVGITPGWGGTTRMSRLIGRRRTKEINLLGALHSARRAVEWGLWNRAVAVSDLDSELQRLLEVLRSKNQQALRQLKLIIDRGADCDLQTAQVFEQLSAGLTAAVNGGWFVEDADHSRGIDDFVAKGETWQQRRGLARDLWTD